MDAGTRHDRVAVLIVRAPTTRPIGAYWRSLGHTILATRLRQAGIPAAFADLSFDRLEDHVTPDTRMVLFSLYIDDFAAGIAAAEQVRQLAPGARTMVGGPHVTTIGADATLAATDAFDVVALGDCLDEALPIIEAAVQGRPAPRGRVLGGAGRPAHLDPIQPDFSAWVDDRYFPLFPVEVSRGCRQHCPFCTEPALRRGLAVDPATRAVRTIEGLVDRHGPVAVRFVDSSLTSLGETFDALLDALIAADLPVQWSSYAYPNDIGPGVAERMARAGARAVFLGVETLAPGVRTGKHHSRAPESVAQAVQSLTAQGIFVHGNFIVGLPGETPGTVRVTLDRLAEIPFGSVGGGPFFLAPGSTFARVPQRHGIEVLDPTWPQWSHEGFHRPRPYFRTAQLDQAQMAELAEQFQAEVRARGLSCWDLSDYPAMCWVSVGGDIEDLARLWRQGSHPSWSPEQAEVLDLLGARGRDGVARPPDFVETTRRVAGAARQAPA